MHGRVKTRTTEEQKEIARREKCKKAKAYQDSMKIVLEKRSACCYDLEALDVTARLLFGNPDIITLWNYRREIFTNLKNEEDLDSYQKLLEKDLSLTEQCLRVNPKSYGSWHHRVWILDNLPTPDWEKELMLCTKYLKLDERNFHCWDYRRIVTQRSNVADLDEYKYTSHKIETNFSNYSAWHLRSKLLPKIFPDPVGKLPIDEDKHRDELELVESAAFTDPNDQSAWFYLRWLLGLTEPKLSLVRTELNEKEIIIVTSRTIQLSDRNKYGVEIRVMVNENDCRGHWEAWSGKDQSCIWNFTLNSDQLITPTDSVHLILEDGSECIKEELQWGVVRKKPNFQPTFSESLKETLCNQLSTCEQLLELEPESKWTLLTSIFLMLTINPSHYHHQVIEGLEKLLKIDPLRSGYYRDMRSKVLIQSAIIKNFNTGNSFRLTGQNLTALYHSQYLYDYEEIDLSDNDLTSASCKQFGAFLNCRELILTGNKIETLIKFWGLPKLETLDLADNPVKHWDAAHFGTPPKVVRFSKTS